MVKFLDKEEWLDVVGYGGKYSISSHGRVRSNFTISKLGKKRLLGTILKTTINVRGYEKVRLYNGVDKTVSVHRLVCAAFYPNPENKPQVNHKDCNPLNNHKDNLEWCTAKENVHHAQLNGKVPIAVPYVKKGRNHLLKMVINLETGEISTSEKVSEKLGIKLNYFWRMLRGERPNTTPFRYVGQEDVVKKPIYGIEQKKPIAVFDMNWKLIKEFDYISQAENFTASNRDSIRDFINGKIGSSKGFKFKMINESGQHIEPIPFIPKTPVYRGGIVGRKMSKEAIDGIKQKWIERKKSGQYTYPAGRKIVQQDLNGVEIQTFKSIGEAVRHLGVKDKSLIKGVLTGKRGKTYKGYKWKYAD